MIDFEKPEIVRMINKLEFSWSNMELLVSAEKLSREGTAELWFYNDNGSGRKLFKVTSVNLLADRTMKSLASSLNDNSEEIPWQQVLTSIITNTVEYQRYGEPGELLKPTTEDISHPGYYIEPVIIKGLPTIIYGDKGVNKTNICLMMMGIAGIGYRDSPSGLNCYEPARAGMLDWESNRDITYYNLSRLVESGSSPYYELPYLKCRRRLIDEIDRIVEWKNEHGLELILIDSLGRAAGTEKYDSAGKEAALNFFDALGQLDITSLIIAQNSKKDTGVKTIYGSTYFTYYARNIFEMVDTKSTISKDNKVVALVHTDSNYSGLYDPLGFRISYTEQSILIESQVVNLSQLKDKISDTEAIMDFMRTESRLVEVPEIADAIQKKETQVRVVLTYLKKKGKVVNPSKGVWGLAQDD